MRCIGRCRWVNTGKAVYPPPGVKGTVIDARVFSRKGVEKDTRTLEIEEAEEIKLRKDMGDETKIMRRAAYSRISRLLDGHTTAAKLVSDKGDVLIGKGVALTADGLAEVPQKYWRDIQVADGQDIAVILANWGPCPE